MSLGNSFVGVTFVASSTLVSYSTNLTKLASTISPSLTVFQSRPWNSASPPLVGGLFSSSCSACCVSDGCRDARGEVGVPRICSAKLPRCERTSGLEAILSAGGGCERPSDAVELFRDCGALSFAFASAWSMVVDGCHGRCACSLWTFRPSTAAEIQCNVRLVVMSNSSYLRNS